ncbi:MAG: type IV secretion system DNA-binding domain-containing protein [Leptospirales bacterium]
MAFDPGPVIFELKTTSRTGEPKVIQFFEDDMARHTVLTGTTGSGKSQIILQLLTQIFRRIARGSNEVVLCTDTGFEFVKKFYDPRFCEILNPFDARSRQWDLFSELVDPVIDPDMLAETLIYEDGDSKNKFWIEFGKILFAGVAHQIKKSLVTGEDIAIEDGPTGEVDPLELLRYLLIEAGQDSLRAPLSGTNAMGIVNMSKDNFGTVRTTITPRIKDLSSLNTGGDFSIRKWIQNLVLKQGNEKRVLFIPYNDRQFPVLKTLISTWLNLVAVQLLSMSSNSHDGSEKRRIWVIADEVDSLGKITALESILTRGRKYGFFFLGAYQSYGQYKKTYGEATAQTLNSNMNTKIILRQGSYPDAEYWSKEIGKVEKTKRSSSVNLNHSGVSTGASTQKALEDLIPASVFSTLPTFHAFVRKPSSEKPIRYRQESPIALPDNAPAFIEARVRTYESEYLSKPASVSEGRGEDNEEYTEIVTPQEQESLSPPRGVEENGTEDVSQESDSEDFESDTYSTLQDYRAEREKQSSGTSYEEESLTGLEERFRSRDDEILGHI